MAENSFRILTETEDFVVIDKLPGVNFHTESNVLGVFEIVKQSLALPELYPVHRLDKVTSGILIMAKHAAANRDLCELFRERRVQKFYLAISGKKPIKKQGAIIGDMAPTRRGAFRLMSSRTNPAITQFFSVAQPSGRRLFILKPHTGKTHQLRVALKSMGAAILGDPDYSDGNLPSDRTYLHAWQLQFEWRGQALCFRTDPREGEHFLATQCRDQLALWNAPEQLPWPQLKGASGAGRDAVDE